MSQDFIDFSYQTLGFPQETAGEHLYMLCLWADELMDSSFARNPDGGDEQIGVIGTLGATALWQSMTLMQLEFPPIVYGLTLESAARDDSSTAIDCTSFYTAITTSCLTDSDISNLCANPTFNFENPFTSSYALTNM